MEVVLIAHNIRSTHNIGSLARSADGMAVKTIYCTGITPYISTKNDDRPPHIRNKTKKDISKTALGAEDSIDLIHIDNIIDLINGLKRDGALVLGLEQSPAARPLANFPTADKIAIVLGSETDGLPEVVIEACDLLIEIPMMGHKESYNVAVAGALAMYELKRSELY